MSLAYILKSAGHVARFPKPLSVAGAAERGAARLWAARHSARKV